MSEYSYNLILGISRVLIIFYLLFVLFPKKIFNTQKLNMSLDEFLPNLILIGSFTIIFLHFLVLANIYDAISLILGFLLITVLLFLVKNKWKVSDVFTRFNSFMLKKFESNFKLAIVNNLKVEKIKDRIFRSSNNETIWHIVLFIVLLITSYLRLKPVRVFAAPFSIESYKTLEYVKHLQIKELFHDGSFVLKGLHCLIDLFFQFSRTDPGILVHIFGALMAVLLTYIIFKIVLSLSNNHVAAILAASIFGIFSNLLPLNIQQQVEANSIILGVIFVITTLFFIAVYLNNRDKKMVYAAIAGIIGTLLINAFMGCMLLIASIPMLLTYLFFNIRPQRSKIFYMTITFSIILISGLFYGLFRIIDGNIIFVENIKSFLSDDSFNSFASVGYFFQQELYSWVSIGIAVLLMIIGLVNRKESNGFFNTFLGLFLIVLALLWNGEKVGLLQIFPLDQIVFLLSTLICISVGMLIDFFLFQLLAQKIKIIYQSEKRQLIFGLVAFVLFAEVLLLSKAVALADFSYVTEPNGYVKTLHAIKNEYTAYQWTCVSHYGAKIQTKNYARYMDYQYFLKYYDPQTFNTTLKNRVPTPYLFIFMEKNKFVSEVATELLPNIKNLTTDLQDWCKEYKKYHNDINVYYEDDDVIVYKILIKTEKQYKIFTRIKETHRKNKI